MAGRQGPARSAPGQLEADLGHQGTTSRAARAPGLCCDSVSRKRRGCPIDQAQDRSLPPVSDAPAVPRRQRSRPPRGGLRRQEPPGLTNRGARSCVRARSGRSAIILRNSSLGGVQRCSVSWNRPPGDRTRRTYGSAEGGGGGGGGGGAWLKPRFPLGPFPTRSRLISRGHAEHHRSGRGDRPIPPILDRPNGLLRLGRGNWGVDRQAPVGQPAAS